MRNCCSFHFVNSTGQETMYCISPDAFHICIDPKPHSSAMSQNMPYVHAIGHSLEMPHTKWNFISCQKYCGRLSQCLSSFHQQQQWQQHHNTSHSTLDDISNSLACFYGFSPYAWKLKAPVSTFPISSSSQTKIHFLWKLPG